MRQQAVHRMRWATGAGRRATQHGMAAMELALLLPVLVTLTMAGFEWARAVQQHERLHHSVRAAVRYLATGDAQDSTRQANARHIAVYGQLTGSTVPVVPGLTVAMVQVLEPDADASVRLVATPQGPVSLVSVVVQGVRYQPLLLPASAGFTLRPVALTLVLRFF